MPTITELLNNIKAAIYGKDVRTAIHDAIKQTYDDASVSGNANMEVSLARGTYTTLGDRLNANDTDISSLNETKANVSDLANGRTFKGSVTTIANLPTTATLGDYYYCSGDTHYYMRNSTGTWIDIGVGDGGYTELEQLSQAIFPGKYALKDITNTWDKLSDYSCDAIGNPVAIQAAVLAGYVTYYKYLTEPAKLYCDASSNTYYAISIGYAAQQWEDVTTSIIARCTTPIRYRKSENNLPTLSTPLTVPTGTLLAITIKNTDSSCGLYAFEKSEFITDDVLTKDISIIPNGSDYNVNFGKYGCVLRHHVDSVHNADLWDIVNICCGETMITNGNLLGVLKEDGQVNFMGGIDHGNETITNITIKCDNKEVTLPLTKAKSCDTLEVIYSSKLYRVSDGTHVYNKSLRIVITKDKIAVMNDVSCVVSDSVLINAYIAGMLDCQYPDIKGTVMNNLYAFPAPTVSPENTSHENVMSVLYWTDGKVVLKNTVGNQLSTYNGKVIAYSLNGTFQRNKIYYDLINGATNVSVGQHLVGEFELLFT